MRDGGGEHAAVERDPQGGQGTANSGKLICSYQILPKVAVAADGFNPNTNWTPDVIGINVGISMLMAANLKSRFVWRTFMKADEISKAMKN